jgi:hypothetical protein
LKHIIVVLMEQPLLSSYYFGWVAGEADGMQAGLPYLDRIAARPNPTDPLAPEFQGCSRSRSGPYLSRRAWLESTTNGGLDGRMAWVAGEKAQLIAIGYYTANDLASVLGVQAAPQVDDVRSLFLRHPWRRLFPTGFYSIALKQTGSTDAAKLVRLPTIWDRLAGKNIRAAVITSGILPILALWGAKSISQLRLRAFPCFWSPVCHDKSAAKLLFVDPALHHRIQEFSNGRIRPARRYS